MTYVHSFLLFTAAALAAAPLTADMADLPYSGDGHMMVTADELVWTDIASMAAPAKIAVIEGDLSKAEPFTFRLRLPAGYRIEPHVHPAYERVTILAGELRFAHGREFDRAATRPLGPGGFAVMPPGAPMFGYAAEDTVIQLHGTGPWGIDYIDPADDPRLRDD